MRHKAMIGLIGMVAILFLFTGVVKGMKMWPSIVYEMWPSVIDEWVAKEEASVTVIEMAEFQQVVDKTDYDMIIDVREPEEYAAGHIPGAINIPRGLIEFEIWRNIGYPESPDTDKKIYVYCQEGRRAFLCTRVLQDLGFSNVTAVNMPLDDWTYAGGTTATLEGSVEFDSDPIDYNLDYGGTSKFKSDPSDYNLDFGVV